jgi:hypothetical protein
MGFNRSPSGFKPEKSAEGLSCGGSPAASTAGPRAKDETAAALCRKRRRVLTGFVGIDVFSIVEKDVYLAEVGVVKELEAESAAAKLKRTNTRKSR